MPVFDMSKEEIFILEILFSLGFIYSIMIYGQLYYDLWVESQTLYS